MSIISNTAEKSQINSIPVDPKTKPFSCLPTAVILEAFSYLKLPELGDCRLLNKECRKLASDEAFLLRSIYPHRIFGKKEWTTYFGDVGAEPPLPKEIHSIFQSPCPFWGGKKVIETHMMVLLPKTVAKKSFTLNSLGELVKDPKKGTATSYAYFHGEIRTRLGECIVKESQWVLMTRDVLPGSREKSFIQQKNLVAAANTPQCRYSAPTLIEAVTSIFMTYFRTGKRLFSEDDPAIEGDLMTYTRCQEQIPVTVGLFDSIGIYIKSGFIDDPYDGIAAVRRM